MKLGTIKQEPKEIVKNALNVLTSCFKGAKYKMLSIEEDFWPD